MMHREMAPCVHCGIWHLGTSGLSKEYAKRDAERESDKCGKKRALLELPDEGLPKNSGDENV